MQEQNSGHECHEDHNQNKAVFEKAVEWVRQMLPSQRVANIQRYPGESITDMMRRLSK